MGFSHSHLGLLSLPFSVGLRPAQNKISSKMIENMEMEKQEVRDLEKELSD